MGGFGRGVSDGFEALFGGAGEEEAEFISYRRPRMAQIVFARRMTRISLTSVDNLFVRREAEVCVEDGKPAAYAINIVNQLERVLCLKVIKNPEAKDDIILAIFFATQVSHVVAEKADGFIT